LFAHDLRAEKEATAAAATEEFRLTEREDDNTLRLLVDGQIAALETTLSKPIRLSLSLSLSLLTKSYYRQS
jgi:hypothetical protein